MRGCDGVCILDTCQGVILVMRCGGLLFKFTTEFMLIPLLGSIIIFAKLNML